MRRRRVLKTSFGFTAVLLATNAWAIGNELSKRVSIEFSELSRSDFAAKITRITPEDASYVHTYYDVCPWSPSGRYFALTRVLPLDRNPHLGEKAACCIIDLQQRTIRTVYSTVCWGFQTGTVMNWGATDRYVFTNDVIDGEAVSVRIDLETGETKALAGPGYHVAPDGSCMESRLSSVLFASNAPRQTAAFCCRTFRANGVGPDLASASVMERPNQYSPLGESSYNYMGFARSP